MAGDITMEAESGKYTYHTPVMVNEVLSFMKPETCRIVLDGTVGGGGHARAVMEKMPPGSLYIGLDRDEEAIAESGRALEPLKTEYKSFVIFKRTFSQLCLVLDEINIPHIDAVLFDLGVSSHQIDTPSRGFSFMEEGSLDMRMDTSKGQRARDIINSADVDELSGIFQKYGEERFSRRIARRIVEARKKSLVYTTSQLKELVCEVIPSFKEIKSCARIFQALRIKINDELHELEAGLGEAVKRLNVDGKILVISYHSLEDRKVKHFMRSGEKPCICSPQQPVCTCGLRPFLKVLTKRPVKSSAGEIKLNSRAKSACLRVAQKIAS